MANPTPNDSIESIRNAVAFGGESIVPGGSNFVKGDLKAGGIYAVAGLAARYTFGLPGLLLVSASSFTKAVTGRHLHEHLGITWPSRSHGSDEHGPAN
jgi:hypothetical protein